MMFGGRSGMDVAPAANTSAGATQASEQSNVVRFMAGREWVGRGKEEIRSGCVSAFDHVALELDDVDITETVGLKRARMKTAATVFSGHDRKRGMVRLAEE